MLAIFNGISMLASRLFARSKNQLEKGLVCNAFRSHGRNKVILGKDPHLCIRDLIKTTYLHPRKSAKGPWRQDNFNATGQPLKALNLLLAWCLCKLWLLPSWSTKCEQKLKLYPLQSQKVILAGPSLHVWKHVNDFCSSQRIKFWTSTLKHNQLLHIWGFWKIALRWPYSMGCSCWQVAYSPL